MPDQAQTTKAAWPDLSDLHAEFDGPIPQQLLDQERRNRNRKPEPGDDDMAGNLSRAAQEFEAARFCIRLLKDIRARVTVDIHGRPFLTYGDRCRREDLHRDLRRHLENWAGRLRIAASIRRRLARAPMQIAAE